MQEISMPRVFQAVIFLLLTSPIPALAQLPPEILVDRYLLQAEQRRSQGNHYGALESLQKILDLQKEHGLRLPDEFHFQQAQVAFSAGEMEAALEAVKKYLTLAGRTGEHYRDALRLLDSAEEKIQEIEAKQRRIEIKRQRAEALQEENTDQAQRQVKAANLRLARDPMKSGGRAPEMVKIAAGRFQYITIQRSGQNLQWVRFDKPFTISKYEVTRGEFEKFVKTTRYRTEAERDPKHGCHRARFTHLEDTRRNSQRWNRPGFDQTATHPVTCISTRDAMAYAEWLSQQTGRRYRVPSAAEWQYAARAGSSAAMLFVTPKDEPNPCRWGNLYDASTGYRFAVKCDDGAPKTTEVGRFRPNDVGLYDLVGNVSELVLECATGQRWALYLSSKDGSPKHPDGCRDLAIGLNRYGRDGIVVALGSNWADGRTDVWDYRAWNDLPAKPGRYPKEWRTEYYKSSSQTVGFRVVKELRGEE